MGATVTWTRWRRTLAGVLVFCFWGGFGPSDAMAQPEPDNWISAHVDIGWRPASRSFTGTRIFTAFEEEANFEADYEIAGGGVVDIGASFLLWDNFAVGLDVSSYRSVNPATLKTDLPHPIFFDVPRQSSGVAGGLERHELGFHLRALWVSRLKDWLVVSFSAGPSLFNARQDLVNAVEHLELEFPFEEVKFTGATVEEQSSVTGGYNVGVNVDTYFLHKLPFLNQYDRLEGVGLGLLLRLVRGSVQFMFDDTPIAVDLGGLQLTAGLRFRF